MEKGRRFVTHLVLRFARLIFMTILLCSIVSFAETTAVLSPPLRQQKSWIVGHTGGSIVNGTAQSVVVPGCTDLCLNAISPIYDVTYVGLSVELYPCQDSENSLFQYDDASKAITMWDPTFNENRCLDAGQFPSSMGDSRFTLQECNAYASQQWIFQADGQIRSGLNNSSSTSSSTQSLFMEGYSRQPDDWGTGLNTFGLYLGTGGGNSNTISSFKLLTYVSPSVVSYKSSFVRQPSIGNMDNMIMNGDFERCGYDPGRNNFADFSSSTWWFIFCYWTISSGSVQLVSSGFWQDPSKAGNASLHLNGYNGPGAVTQLVSTLVGSNYSLSLNLAGDVTISCGSTVKTLDVSITPSSLPLTSLSFNVSGKTPGAMGWISPSPLDFTAYGTSVNFTFQSTTDGNCGPLIDNVSVRKAQDGTIASEKSADDNSVLLMVLTVTISVVTVGVLAPTLFCCYFIWRRRHRGDLEKTLFVKGVRSQSEMDILEAGFNKSENESFSGTYGLQYSWEELEKATGNFRKVLANGGSGLLFLAEFSDGLLGAVKVDTTSHRRQCTSDEAFKHEVAILHRLHHAYLVSFIGVCIGQGSRRALVFEYMPNGNLFDRLHNLEDDIEPLSWQTRMVIAYQVACAIEYLHEEASPPVVHRDVQTSNVLLQRDDSAKLAAFDVSRSNRSSIISSHSSFETSSEASPVKKSSSVPYGYLDPVFHRSGRVSKKSDVYSYGMLLLEIITGLPAAEFDSKAFGTADFSKSTEEMVNTVDPKLMGKFDEHELSEVIDIAAKCLKPEPKSRLSMSEVVVMLKTVFSST